MMIRGGENIYPREIEEFLYRHPTIQDVQVFGVPDRALGEELCAWIKLKPGAQARAKTDIRDFCQGQIAHYKVAAIRPLRRRVPDDRDRARSRNSSCASG